MALSKNDYDVIVSPDKLEAILRLGGEINLEELTRQDLATALKEKGISAGIDEDLLTSIAESPVTDIEYKVAAGTAPANGTDGQITYHFPTDPHPGGDSHKSGSVDFRQISNFHNVLKDDLLAEVTLPTAGAEGTGVKGEVLKAKDGKRATVKTGKGVVYLESENRVVAEENGHACIINDRICVLGTVEVQGEVDYSVGNIDFIGNVIIRGGVMPNFSVTARGDIEIAGNVEKAEIHCGGELAIRGIVFGHENCLISSEGNAEINAIDQAEVNIQGNLTVGSYIRHCTIRSGAMVVVEGNKGSIIGGEICALKGIKAPFVGNNMATLTKLIVGVNPFHARELDSLVSAREACQVKSDQVISGLSTMKDKLALAGADSERITGTIAKLELAGSQLAAELSELDGKITELRATSKVFNKATIKVTETIHSGVVVNFRERLQYKTMDDLQAVMFYEEESEIRTGSL